MKQDSEIPAKLQAFIAEFDDGLSEDAFNDERYSYRLIFTRKFANSKGQADVAIEFIDPKSATGEAINKEYWVQKEVEKTQYLPSQIVALMQEEGITRFKVHHHTQLWQDEDAKNPSKGYGTQLVNTWYWYESWISKVRDHCLDKPEQYS